jgi:hypothetical protein
MLLLTRDPIDQAQTNLSRDVPTGAGNNSRPNFTANHFFIFFFYGKFSFEPWWPFSVNKFLPYTI